MLNLQQRTILRLSMTENSNPHENALTKRMNRTIKEKFRINRKLKPKNQAIELIKESITNEY